MRRIQDKRMYRQAARAGMVVCMAMVAAAAGARQQTVPSAAILEQETEMVPRYSVEMIVFEYAGSASDTTEMFDPDMPADLLDQEFIANEFPQEPEAGPATPTGDPAGAMEQVDVVGDDDEDAPFVPLPGEVLELIPTYELKGVEYIPPEEYQLTAAYEKLVTLDAYRPLVHTAWIQPTVSQEEAEALDLRRLGDPPLRLEGTVSTYLGRFLHVALDLSLVDQNSPQVPPEAESSRYYGDDRSDSSMGFRTAGFAPRTVYRIQEDRILRNNETRYFDHPRFGVIVKVMRIEDNLPETLDTTGDLLPGINQ